MVFKRIKTRILDNGRLSLKGLIKVLQEHEDKLKAITGIDTSQLADIGELQTIVGDSESGLVKDVASLKTSKANSNHSHELSNISDLETVEVVVTYDDESTETLNLIKQNSS